MAGNVLTDIVAPAKRRAIYASYSAVGVVIGGIQAGMGSVNATTPNWLKVLTAVYAFAGTVIGATAASNTPATKKQADV